MNRNWIAALLLTAALLPGCKSDKEVITGVSDAPPPPTATDSKQEAPVPTDHGPPKVDPGKYATTSTGLKHATIKEGKGPAIKSLQRATVHYTGWLQSDETKFDSSRDRGQPLDFVIDNDQIIKGWHQGVKGMKVGEQRILVIPPDLAYGPDGRPGIPGGATLIFAIELLKIGDSTVSD